MAESAVSLEDGVDLDDLNSEEDPETEMELKDGVLVIGDGNFGVVHLTEGGGICLSLGGLLDLDFVPAE